MIYLDNNATTQLDPLILEALLPHLGTLLGNPASTHLFGQQAKALLVQAVRQTAQFFGVTPEEIVFTSGATEALNFLLGSIPKSKHVITSSLEHAAVIEPLKRSGASVTYLDPMIGKGAIQLSQIEEVFQENTSYIVLSSANNETGIKTDIGAIGAFAEKKGVHLIVDAVAQLGKDPLVASSGVTASCYSGHKIHGPLGSGVAIVRKNFKTNPLIVGGGQQRNMRSGTENLPAILGFAHALSLINPEAIERMEKLRDRLEEGLLSCLKEIIIHGKGESRVANTSNIAFLGVSGETLLMALDMQGVAVSHGSACSSGSIETSRVLRAMGIESSIARSSLRFSLSRLTTEDEIERAIEIITTVVKDLR